MSNDVNVSCGGIFAAMLAVLFIGLKITGYIDWSWWWVLAPLWMPAVIVILLIIVIVVVATVMDN